MAYDYSSIMAFISFDSSDFFFWAADKYYSVACLAIANLALPSSGGLEKNTLLTFSDAPDSKLWDAIDSNLDSLLISCGAAGVA